ncbi:hypothetical protein BKA63DRAFT_527757 [Paraphoma chrysanthemicola]|nr:hypothetical protein BKA63DRAFT_527757 [Paraphoma chrysanthemicola]
MTQQDNRNRPTKEEIEAFRIKARCCAELHKVFWELCTPKEFEQTGQEIFGGTHHAERILSEFKMYHEVYEVVWPDEAQCPAWGRAIAKEEFGHDIEARLEAFIAIPNRLLHVTMPTRLGMAIRMPGGGGTTGHSNTPKWECQADHEFILEAGDMFGVSTSLLSILEAGEEKRDQSARSFATFILSKLESVLKRANPFLAIAWENLYLFGISYGASAAMLVYKDICTRQDEWPPGFCITHAMFRCPLLDYYYREDIFYMGIVISKERAVRDAKAIFAIKQKLPFLVYRAGTHPPTAMWPAHVIPRANMWSRLWGPKSMLTLIEESPDFPMPTKFGLWHGTEDSNVPFEQTLAAGDLFCRKGSPDVTVYLEEGKPHAWDYEESLTAEKREFLNKRGATASSGLKIVRLRF